MTTAVKPEKGRSVSRDGLHHVLNRGRQGVRSALLDDESIGLLAYALLDNRFRPTTLR